MRIDFASLIDWSRFRDERAGAVGVMFAFMAVPCVLTVGAAIDLTRATQFKTTLQAAVDSAALAGAGAYSDAATATSVANKYMNASLSYLPGNVAVNFTVTPATIIKNGQTAAYTVAVTATGTVKTTFMAIAIPTLTIGATATAEDPVMNAAANFTGFSSSAGDANTLYIYPVPTDGSLPPSSSWTQIYSNAPSPGDCATATPSAPNNISFRSSQKIGFVLQNVTGGLCPYSGVGAYGQTQGSVHYFYSQLMPPSSQAFPSFTQNCAFQSAVITGSTLPQPANGSCSATMPQYSTPTCAQLNGSQIRYFWNDMGGAGTDDKDYNDAVFSFGCSSATSSVSATQVVLIK